MPQILAGKKIAMIIAFRDFRDEEYFIPKQILRSAGAEIFIASNDLGKAIGSQGGDTDVNILIDNLKVDDFDGVLFIGGPGASKFIDNEKCHQVARETLEKGKVLGAICIAPAILAKAGVLEGKKATVWSSPMDKSTVKILKENGALYEKENVVVAGNIITASGPYAAREFAQTLLEILKSR